MKKTNETNKVGKKELPQSQSQSQSEIEEEIMRNVNNSLESVRLASSSLISSNSVDNDLNKIFICLLDNSLLGIRIDVEKIKKIITPSLYLIDKVRWISIEMLSIANNRGVFSGGKIPSKSKKEAEKILVICCSYLNSVQIALNNNNALKK
jgi:hypothetical protein